MTIILILLLYSIICTLLILKNYLNENTRTIDSITMINNAISSLKEKKEQIEMSIELEKVKLTKIPWYEKSISAIGTIVFFSMLTATTIQLIQTNEKKDTITELQKVIEKGKKNETEIKQFVIDAGNYFLDDYDRSGLSDNEELLLTKYVEILEQRKKLNKQENLNLFWAYMILKKYDLAIRSVNNRIITQNEINIPDKITLAEYYTITSDFDSAKEIIIDITNKKLCKELSNSYKKRFFALQGVLKIESEDEIILNARRALDKKENESRKIIANHMNNLIKARKERISFNE